MSPSYTLYPISQVDAFTTTPFEGNPCAVVYDADPLDDDVMLKIAREMNLSETAFVKTSSVATIGARYFTPKEELPLAGHPTIATIHSLFETGRLTFDTTTNDTEPQEQQYTQITLELKAGIIPIDVYGVNGKVTNVVMAQIKPTFLATYDPSDIMPLLGLSVEDIFDGSTIQTVSTGTPQLMIYVKSVNTLKKVQFDSIAYKSMRERGDFFSVHVFSIRSIDDDSDDNNRIIAPSNVLDIVNTRPPPTTTTTFARHFPEPEDPFTGSSTGNMGAYLWRYGYIDSPTFIAQQGHWLGRPGQATVEVIGKDRYNIDTVKVGGAAVTVMDGTLKVPN
jgi:trans-2,3-dihydro-3-hydroxyanthranilate isomerase